MIVGTVLNTRDFIFTPSLGDTIVTVVLEYFNICILYLMLFAKSKSLCRYFIELTVYFNHVLLSHKLSHSYQSIPIKEPFS